MSWLVPRGELTPAQSRAVTSSREQHRLVLGSPGSGKTVVLLHRARHLIDEYRIPPERCRLFVFTNALKAYIRAALRDLELPDDCVMTFDAWCDEYYQDRVNKRLPWNDSSRKYDWDAVRRTVWEKTRLMTTSDRLYDFVMVDEGQDLDRRDFETLTAVAQHVTVFMDPKQKLYERDADETGVARALGLRRRNLVLLDAYRCSPYIVQAGASFVRDEAERRQFIEQNPPVKQGGRQLPLLYLANDADDELGHLIEVVRTRIDRNERIAILFPTRRHMFGYGRALREAGLEVEVNKHSRKNKRREDALPGIDFGTPLPKLMPYPSSKGLTFDTVLMPRLNRGFVKKIDPDRLERWLFVGITRATRWFYVSTTDGENALFLERFRELERRKQMTVQRDVDRPVAGGAAEIQDGSLGDTNELTDLF